MNYILFQGGYPLVIIAAQDRNRYIKAVQQALQGDADAYYELVYKAIERSLNEYLQAVEESE